MTGTGETFVVRRVLDLLADVSAATQDPWDAAATARLERARRSGAPRRDLLEIRDRMERLRGCHPELRVEMGPLLGLAGDYVDAVEEDLVGVRGPADARMPSAR
jgi:hypothetical protein